MSLAAVVMDAASASLEKLDGAAGWFSNPDRFAHELRRRWLYNNNVPSNIDLRTASGPFYFLLYKSLSVTNVSAIEAAALIRLYARDRQTDAHRTAQFCSGTDFASFVSNAWSAYTRHLRPAPKAAATAALRQIIPDFVRAHEVLFETTCVLEIYYTSILLAIPPSLSVDIAALIAESGYIHSGGPVVYARNIQKADIAELEERITGYLEAETERKIYVVPYAEEFFSPYDTDTPVSLRNGLNNVKLKLRKPHIEDQPLLEYLTLLHNRFDQLYVPKGIDDFKDERRDAIDDSVPAGERCTKVCTLWFVTDANFSMSETDVPYRGDESYLFVYAQYVKNNSQLIMFKERKPGWYASITLPHTLSIGATNILRQARAPRGDRPLFILDPFCGTGTSLIDFALRVDGAAVVGLDRSGMSSLVVEDNLDFLAREPEEISALMSHFKQVKDEVEEADDGGRTFRHIEEIAANRTGLLSATAPAFDTRSMYERAVALLLDEFSRHDNQPAAAIRSILNSEFSEEFQNRLKGPLFSQLNARLLVYVLWRACANGLFILRDSHDVEKLFGQELKVCLNELDHLRRLISKPALGELGRGHELCEGAYSKDTRVRRDVVRTILDSKQTLTETDFLSSVREGALGEGLHLVKVGDSIDVMQSLARRVDIVVTDPPYGFNTQEGGASALKNFYQRLPGALVEAVAPGGEILLVLPEFARNGRQIPFFETKDSLVRQMLASAHAAGRTCTNVAETTSGPTQLGRFPARWSSASVLERSVLKFRIEG